MPCLSGRFDPAVGPLLNVAVLPLGTITPAGLTVSSITTFPALLDTGATITCISPSIASSLALRPIGMRTMVSATHSTPVNTYLVDIILPFGQAGFTMAGKEVMEFAAAPGSPYQMLVGRDIICRGTLALSFDGHYTFSL